MSKSFCELLLQFYPKISEFEDLQSTYVANCVFNSFLCYSAIMLNIVTIHAIRKTSSLPKTLKTLFLSLAVSDVGVGLLGQPSYISLLVMWLQQSNPGCSTYKGFLIVLALFFFSIILWCCGCKCRQVPSYSSSSQIPGTCDSQTCCCCCDLNMAV